MTYASSIVNYLTNEISHKEPVDNDHMHLLQLKKKTASPF